MTEPGRDEPLVITPDMLAPGSRGARVDFERGMRAAPPLVLVLVALNVAMFAGQIAAGALQDQETIVAAGALHRESVLAGEWWRLISAMFLHGGPDHVIGNLLVLYVIGMAVEHALGLVQTAAVYFAGGVAGGLLSLAMGPGPSVGASGAIFGLIASVIVVLYRHRDRWHVRDKRIGFVLIVWAAYQVGTGFLTPFIDNFAHLGGFAGGAGATLLVRPRLLDYSA
ncbi:MAG: rhomboid family intramembrane serine protease [Gemmatimonadales bacterium]